MQQSSNTRSAVMSLVVVSVAVAIRPICRAPLLVALVRWRWGRGEPSIVTENRKWKIPLWSAVFVDQVWTAEQRSVQEEAEGADSYCSPTSSPSTTARQQEQGPRVPAGVQGSCWPGLLPDQSGQPCCCRGKGCVKEDECKTGDWIKLKIGAVGCFSFAGLLFLKLELNLFAFFMKD